MASATWRTCSRLGHLDGDFVQLHALGLEAAAAHFDEHLAVASLGGFQGDEHLVRGGLGAGLGFVGLHALAARLHHADDAVVIAADAHVPAEG